MTTNSTAPEVRSTDAPRPKRRGRILVRIAALLVATPLAIVLVEVTITGLNLFGANYGREIARYFAEATIPEPPAPSSPGAQPDLDGVLFRHRPNVDLEFSDFRLRLNALGLRGPEVSPKKPANTYRILAIGDSVTLGWGVDDEVTFVRRLERALNEQLGAADTASATPGRPRYEVVNAGHMQFDTVQQAALFDDLGPLLRPDLVVLTYVVNDIDLTSNLFRRQAELIANPPPPPSLGQRTWAWLNARLPGTLAVTNLFLHPPPEHFADAEARRAYRPERTKAGAEGWTKSQAALLRIRDRCAAIGARLLVLDHTYPAIRPLPTFAVDEQIPLRSLQYTDTEHDLDIYNSMSDSHANAAGHELLLTKLRAALRAEGLFDLR